MAGSLWFLTSLVRSAGCLQLEYLSVGLHFRGSRLLHWGIQTPSSVLWWELSGNPTPLGIPITSQGLCGCPGAALTGIFSWDAHQVLYMGWWDRLRQESAGLLCAPGYVQSVAPSLAIATWKRKEGFLPSACSAGSEPVSWGREGTQGGMPPASMTEPYLQEDGSSSSPMQWQRPGKQAGVPAGRLLHSPGCNWQNFV